MAERACITLTASSQLTRVFALAPWRPPHPTTTTPPHPAPPHSLPPRFQRVSAVTINPVKFWRRYLPRLKGFKNDYVNAPKMDDE